MLNAEKFYIHATATKNIEGFDNLEYVKSLVRNTELSKALAKASFKNAKKALEDAHIGIDVMKCDEKIIIETLNNDAGQFIKDRDEILSLREECEKCLPIEKVTSLELTDRVHIIIMAHEIYNSVVLDDDIFDTEKGGIDISAPVRDFYAKGTMKSLKDSLRSVFHKLVGTEGEYFYGMGTRKSDFEDKDIRNFLAAFGGTAKRTTTKKGKETIFGNFDYVDKSDNKKVQIKAFTTLCAVVIDNAKKHTVFKSGEKAEENVA